MKIFYFTTTGNSLSVAKAISGDLISMVGNNHIESYDDDAIGFIFPCYKSSLPTIVEDFFKNHKFKAKYTFAILTYGNVAMGSVNHINKIAKKYGLSFDYINQIRMLDNSLNFYDMEKQLKALPNKHVGNQLTGIINDIKKRNIKKVKSNALLEGISEFGYNAYRRSIVGFEKKFYVESHCNKCTICMKVCPVNNINVTDQVRFSTSCIGCFACTHHCPQNAIRFNKEKSKTRYRHAEITLKEIIDANNH